MSKNKHRYRLRNVLHDQTVEWSLSDILKEINSDRCDGWQDYDESDWREGLAEFTEWRLVDPMEGHSWEEAFSKFGFGDGEHLLTYVVVDALLEFGAEVTTDQWPLHNEIIISIKLGGVDLISEDLGGFRLGYDDPRAYLPRDLVAYLDRYFSD